MSVNVGTGVKRARGKGGATLRIRNAWDPVSEDRLLQWIEVRLNYECWKCSSSTDSSGKKNTSGKRKIDVSRNSKIPSKLRNYAMGTRANPKQSAGLENSWRNAQDYLSKTGEALSDEEKRANLSINGLLPKMCPAFDRVDAILRDRPGHTAPYVSDSSEDPQAAIMIVLPEAAPNYAGAEPKGELECPAKHDVQPTDKLSAEDESVQERKRRVEGAESGDDEVCRKKIKPSTAEKKFGASKKSKYKTMSIADAMVAVLP